MDQLKAMQVFIQVAKHQSFAPAAKALNISNSAASRHIHELEEWLDIDLFERTTRKTRLTDAGKSYLFKCQEVVKEISELKESAASFNKKPQGKVKVTMPNWLAERYISPKLPIFLKKHPDIIIDLFLLDQPVSLKKGDYDIVVGCGLSKLKNFDLIARKIADDELFLVASPEYLIKNGKPTTIEDIKHHNCIVDKASPFENRWPLRKSKRSVSVEGNIWVNSGDIAKQLAIDGAGITLLPKLLISREIENGTLVPFLKNQINYKGYLYMIYKPVKNQPPATKLFIDFALRCFENISYY